MGREKERRGWESCGREGECEREKMGVGREIERRRMEELREERTV